MFDTYSKNDSEVIQPLSDFPIPQPLGTLITICLGILSYGYMTIGGAKTPSALPEIKNIVPIHF